MEEHQIGWIAAIIIGGIAGWLAEQFMKSQMGLLMNIVLGIVGAAVASWLFSLLGITFGGWIGYLIAGFIGACILIAIARAFSGGPQTATRKPPFRESRGGLSTKKKTHEFIFSNKIPCCVQMRSI